MNYGSVTSGIESATVAWHPLGWKPQWFSEIEPFPCKVLKYYYPTVPNLGDMLKLTENETFKKSTINLLVGGTPCQSFSIAGLRRGLDDERGNLALEFCRLLIAKRPRWFVWENVPGVLSSFSDEEGSKEVEGIGPEHERDITETADFATLLKAFSECGYCCAWRILDSQFFGVPQRRRRLFVVGHFGTDWRPPFAVLFEPHSLRGDIAPGRKEGQKPAFALNGSPAADRGEDGNLISSYTIHGTDKSVKVASETNTHTALMSRPPGGIENSSTTVVTGMWWDGSQTAQTLDAVLQKGQTMPEKNRFPAVLQPFSIMPENSGKDFKAKPVTRSQTLTTNGNHGGNQGDDYVIQPEAAGFFHRAGSGAGSTGYEAETSPTLKSGADVAVQSKMMVRRLTPLECERLQGFPDHYTAIPGAKDGPRYKALGNSMTVNVMAWIGRRIDKADKIFK